MSYHELMKARQTELKQKQQQDANVRRAARPRSNPFATLQRTLEAAERGHTTFKGTISMNRGVVPDTK